MANQWLRLWHDMPNDPKWRTIARVSKQPISAVLAVYVHLLVIASNATERGRTQNVCSEDLASALDLDTEQVDAILSAMQGRVLDGDMVSGWAKRQVEREDGSAERAKRWRDAQKEAKQTQANAPERKQTPDKDTDKDTEIEKEISQKQRGATATRLPADWKPSDEDLAFCKCKRPDLNPFDVADGFVDYWIAQAGAKGRKSDWHATWRNWVRNEAPPKHAKGSASQFLTAQQQRDENNRRSTAEFLNDDAPIFRVIDGACSNA